MPLRAQAAISNACCQRWTDKSFSACMNARPPLRWHVRAYCEKNRDFRDFVLSRFRGINDIEGDAAMRREDDVRWNSMVNIILVPDSRLTDYQKAIIPLAQKVLDQMLAGYQQGVFDMTDLLAAQQEILLAKRNVIDLQYALHLQLLELERLTGLPMVVNGPEAFTQRYSGSSLPPQQELSQ